MSAEELRGQIEKALGQARLLHELDRARSQYLDFPDSVYVELVLTDAGKADQIREALNGVASEIELQIHPVWRIETIEEPELVVSQSASINIAKLVAVTLRSGSVTTMVHVSVTWMAEQELRKILGTEPDLKELVREYLENRLAWGGQSYWDPQRYGRLEIASDRALSLYRSLQKTA